MHDRGKNEVRPGAWHHIFTGSTPGWFVEVAMLKPAPSGESVMLTHDVKSATEVGFTGSGSAPAAGDYPNAAIEIGIARYDGEELVSETLTVPIHLVVGE